MITDTERLECTRWLATEIMGYTDDHGHWRTVANTHIHRDRFTPLRSADQANDVWAMADALARERGFKLNIEVSTGRLGTGVFTVRSGLQFMSGDYPEALCFTIKRAFDNQAMAQREARL